MNAPHPLQALNLPLNQAQMPGFTSAQNDEINLLEYWDIIADNRWLIVAVTAVAVAVGGAYALFANPVYESNLLIQVEDSAGSASGLLGEAANLFEVKTPATAEIEIIRSRMVIGQAVDNTLLYVEAQPNYLPVVGNWLSRRATSLSTPMRGWVTGTESIKVHQFDVPRELEGTRFRITIAEDGRYILTHPDLDTEVVGLVGSRLTHLTTGGALSLQVAAVEARPGAEFNLIRHPRLEVIGSLQEDLKIAEKGRQSGVIDATLQDSDPRRLTLVLNEIGQQYIRQNVERKAAEAQKTLSFLDVQLPQFKKQLDQSEEAYNRYRNQKGTVALDEESKLILTQSVEMQSKLMEVEQKRRELVSRFTDVHPTVRVLDGQIAAWRRELAALGARVKSLPAVQQDAVRLERDVKVNSELYHQLRNSAIQLQLVREGKVGNVRLIDTAATPVEPARPKRALVLALATAMGLLMGILFAIARNAFFRGLRSPQEVEAATGLSVYSTIPHSELQDDLARKVADKQSGLHVLSQAFPQDVAVESLRSLRTALQFAMIEAGNNRVVITGATPGVGKSFVSANFAAVLAAGGKRVLLIDADLRKGHLNQYFGIPRANGLSELIAGSVDFETAIKRQLTPNLDIIPTGVLPPNPAELVLSGAFARLLERLSGDYDLVVIDTAPVLAAADTLSIATHAGTLLLVARAGQSQIGELHESARRLSHAGRVVTGVLFNAIDLKRRHFGHYGYKYGAYRYRQYSYHSN